MTGLLCAFGGATAGALQVGSIARRARRHVPPWSLFARIALVAGVLLLSARLGHLMLAATGWLAGYLVMCAVTYRRLG